MQRSHLHLELRKSSHDATSTSGIGANSADDAGPAQAGRICRVCSALMTLILSLLLNSFSFNVVATIHHLGSDVHCLVIVSSDIKKHLLVICGVWWLSGRFAALCPEGRRFESSPIPTIETTEATASVDF